MNKTKLPLTHSTMDTTPQGAVLLQGYIGSEPVGILALAPVDEEGNRTVLQVWTHQDYRRIGVASHLWKMAKAHNLNPTHDHNQTAEGFNWSRSIGN